MVSSLKETKVDKNFEEQENRLFSFLTTLEFKLTDSPPS
jgi:hypothetical protein